MVATEVESPETVSLFPQDLETTNNIVSMALDFLMEDLSVNPDTPIPLSIVSHHISEVSPWLRELVGWDMMLRTLIIFSHRE